VRDAAGVEDCPQWESGEEPVLAGEQCIVLATRPDLEGDVELAGQRSTAAHQKRQP
jgi:hypothetical protein